MTDGLFALYGEFLVTGCTLASCVGGYTYLRSNMAHISKATGIPRKRSFQLPSDDIEGWLKAHAGVNYNGSGGINDTTYMGVRHPESRAKETLKETGTQAKRKRHDMPIVRKVDKVSSVAVHEQISDIAERDKALEGLLCDFYAASSDAPRTSQLKTWEKYHKSWYGGNSSAWPMTEHSLIRVSALFKLGCYKSFKNYLSRAKDHHVSLGHTWTDKLDLVARKCSRSVLRGLAGSTRSMDFDLDRLAKRLQEGRFELNDQGPVHPRSMFITATLFLLRELEASALDVGDVVLQ